MRRLVALVIWVALAGAASSVLAATVVHNLVPQFSQGISDGIAVPVGRTSTPP